MENEANSSIEAILTEGFEAGYWIELGASTQAVELRQQLENMAVKDMAVAHYLRGWDKGVEEAKQEKAKAVVQKRRNFLTQAAEHLRKRPGTES